MLIKEVFKEIEYEKQKLLLYKRSAENELHDKAHTMAEVLAIQWAVVLATLLGVVLANW